MNTCQRSAQGVQLIPKNITGTSDLTNTASNIIDKETSIFDITRIRERGGETGGETGGERGGVRQQEE